MPSVSFDFLSYHDCETTVPHDKSKLSIFYENVIENATWKTLEIFSSDLFSTDRPESTAVSTPL